MSDLDIIAQLEQRIGKKLEKLDKFKDNSVGGYQLNAQQQVTGLGVCKRELQEFPREICQLQQLQELYLSRNQLAQLPAEIGQLQRLQSLNLSSNQFAQFPKEIIQLRQLQSLDLTGNQLRQLPKEIEQLQQLQSLNLSSNQLAQFPKEIIQLRRLQTLDLSENHLKQLLEEIGQLQQLQSLNLGSNQFAQFPKEVIQLWQLQTLNLYSSRLKLLPEEIAQLQQLQSLNLSGNHFTQFPKGVVQLRQLQTLSLDENHLKQLPEEIGQLQQLQSLGLWSNRLMELPKEIGQLQRLQWLDLSYNQLTQLPKEIGQLQQLQSLNLRGNQLTQLPKELLHLNLEVNWNNDDPGSGIDVKGNHNFQIPPVEIVKKGKQAIIDYYDALAPEQPVITTPTEKQLEKSEVLKPAQKTVVKPRPLNELKLLLVGDGGVGKTSLLKRLSEQPFDRAESQTHGINLNTVEMTVPALDNATVKLHCWDFGGQEIMHATHQFFLTKRSLYLVVLDARRETKTDYWLKQIQQVSDNAPVIIVINKIDENSHFDLPRDQLKQKFPNIKQFCKISCATDAGLTDLMTAIQHIIPKVELVQTLFPASWWQVKTAIVEQAQTKNFTSYDHFVELCQANEIYEESAQHTLINFLHELGIVTHFDQPWLRETNVINPRWLTEAVYKLVTAKQAINGKLPRTELTQLLDSKTYPSHKHDYLISLIERFELCYRFDENTLLFPELLQHDEPNLTELRQQIQQIETLHFILLYSDFLPKSIFTRFMVRSQRYIDKNYLWKTGVVLRDLHKQTTALVQLDEKSQKITLHLMGTHQQDFLAVLLFLLRDIHNSFPRLHVDERLALPDNPAITVSYNDLLERLQDGETEIRPEGAKQKYNIRQLLGTAYHSKPTEAEIMAFLRTLIDSQTIPDEKTFWQKFKDSIELKIPFGLGSIDLKGLVRAAFKK